MCLYGGRHLYDQVQIGKRVIDGGSGKPRPNEVGPGTGGGNRGQNKETKCILGLGTLNGSTTTDELISRLLRLIANGIEDAAPK